MAYALFRTSSGPVDRELLTTSFARTDELTHLDARLALSQPSGVLARGLSRPSASAVQHALAEGGVDSEVVDGAWLTIPAPIAVSRADVEADALMATVRGQVERIPWSDVVVVAAGTVPKLRAVKMAEAERSPLHRARAVLEPPGFRNEQRPIPMIDLLVGEPPRRLRLGAGLADEYAGPGRRERMDLELRALIDSVAQHATCAVFNQGVRDARCDNGHQRATYRSHDAKEDERRPLFAYRSRRQLETDLAWLLWRHHRRNAEQDDAKELAPPFATPSMTPPSAETAALSHARLRMDTQLEKTRRGDMVLSAGAGSVVVVALTMTVNPLGLWWLPVALVIWLGAGVIAYEYLRSRRRRTFWMG